MTQYTSHGDTAKRIKKELKAAFPGTEWSVRTAHGSTINIHWTDGPTTEMVDGMVGKYEHGYFDGMDDMYHYTDSLIEDGVKWSVKYVFTNRHQSPAAEAIFGKLIREYGNLESKPEDEINHRAYREWIKWDATTDALPETTEDLPSHKEWVRRNGDYEAALRENEALAAADYPEYPEDGRGDSPDDAPGSFCHKPMTVARPAQSWKVW